MIDDKVFIRGFTVLLVAITGFSAIGIFYMQQQFENITCSYTNITNIYPQEYDYQTVIYNNTNEYYIPMRNFYFSARQRHYCKDPIEWSNIGGQSMFPLLDASGTILVDRVQWKDLEVGDAILFVRNGSYIFHAITYINNEYGMTAGYNNDVQDSDLLYPEDVKYRYCVPRYNPKNKFSGGEN